LALAGFLSAEDDVAVVIVLGAVVFEAVFVTMELEPPVAADADADEECVESLSSSVVDS
jgi:hypothetical protein